MISKTATITNKTGLHARPAGTFVKTASKFKSGIKIKDIKNDAEANAKSIIFLLSLGLVQGTEVEITADGEDEEEAVNTLVDLIQSGFGE